jgi:hypothetical protein
MNLPYRAYRKIWVKLLGDSSWIDATVISGRRSDTGLSRGLIIFMGCCAQQTWRGIRERTVVEFGVASGAGLLDMIRPASDLEEETGVKFRIIVGFDTGRGLPSVQGYKDHPELCNAGDFAMEDKEYLMGKIAGRVEIIWGDIAETVGSFTDSLDPAAPLGFVSNRCGRLFGCEGGSGLPAWVTGQVQFGHRHVVRRCKLFLRERVGGRAPLAIACLAADPRPKTGIRRCTSVTFRIMSCGNIRGSASS